MAIAYNVDQGSNVVRLRASGTLVPDDLVSLWRDLETDPRIGSWRAIFDMTDVTEIALDADYLRTLAHRRPSFPFRTPDERVAIVAPSDVAFGMSRMFSQLAGSEDTMRVFRDVKDAEDWLR
jgi:hypothetical protein